MTKKERALLAVQTLEEVYPQATCALQYEKALRTADRGAAVGTVHRCKGKPDHTKAVRSLPHTGITGGGRHRRFGRDRPSLRLLSHESQEHQGNVCPAADFGGVVPDNMKDLLSLSGVGRKTANLILGDVYGKPAIVADTHFIRITGRLGLTKSKDPVQVEKDLRPLIPPERSSDFCHRVVWFGRDTCRARKPRCKSCPMAAFCPSRSE